MQSIRRKVLKDQSGFPHARVIVITDPSTRGITYMVESYTGDVRTIALSYDALLELIKRRFEISNPVFSNLGVAVL